MTHNSHIEQLIHDLCPSGVLYKTLGELGIFASAGVDKKIVPDEKKVTLLNYVDIYKNNYIDASIPSMVVTASDKKIEQCNVLKNDIFITPSSETKDDIGHAAVIVEDLPYVVYSYHIMRYRLKNPNTTTAKYIRYLFDTSIITQQILKVAQGLTRFGLSKFQFAALTIPFPPKEIQEEIVRLFDIFKDQINNIDAEIIERRVQYEYSREQLFNFDGRFDIEFKKLGEFATAQKTKNRKHITENAYSITQAGLIPTKSFFKEKTNVTSSDTSGYIIVEHNWFVYSPSRVDVGSISYLKDKGPVIVSPIDVVFSIDTNICLPSFLLSYFFTHEGKRNILKNREGVEGTGRRNLPFEAIQTIPIPLPSLSEQRAITENLDTIEALINNLKTERDLRQQQYEYYREYLINLLK